MAVARTNDASTFAAATSFEILLVEDNAADVRLTQEALRDSRTPYNLNVMRDGAAALDYLRRCNRQPGSGDQVRPHLILLDLNMPRTTGWEVLEKIKNDPGLRTIPVVVVSTSSSLNDIRTAYDLHANAYVVKPVDLDEFLAVMQAVHHFWSSVASQPRMT